MQNTKTKKLKWWGNGGEKGQIVPYIITRYTILNINCDLQQNDKHVQYPRIW